MSDERRADRFLLVGLLALAVLALALRLPGLGDRPLHSDESVQGWFLLRLRYTGVYRYNPANYHGPLMYFLAVIPTWLLGPGEVALRLPSALMGAGIPLLLWPARRAIGRTGVMVAGLLLVVAPAQVYYSRSFIQEIQLVFFTLLWVVALLRFWQRPGAGWSRAAALAAVGAFASKETAVITVACLAAGGGLAWLAGRPDGAERDLFAGAPRQQVPGALRRALKGHGEVGVVLFVGLLLLLYSTFLTDPMGAARFFAGFVPWVEYGVTGRNQGKPTPWFWELLGHTVWLYRWALPVLLAAALALRSRVGLALSGWAVASFAVYSLIPYKTPWCALQIELPLLLAVGWLAGEIVRRAGSGPRRLGAAAAVALLLVPALLPVHGLLARSLDDVRGGWEYRDRPYVYVQATRRTYELVSDLAGLHAVDPEASEEGLALVHAWPKHPIRWYTMTRGLEGVRTVRRHKVPKPGDVEAADAVLVRAGSWSPPELEEWHVRRYRIRAGRQAELWVRQELWARYREAGERKVRPWPIPPVRPMPVPDFGEMPGERAPDR